MDDIVLRYTDGRTLYLTGDSFTEDKECFVISQEGKSVACVMKTPALEIIGFSSIHVKAA